MEKGDWAASVGAAMPVGVSSGVVPTVPALVVPPASLYATTVYAYEVPGVRSSSVYVSASPEENQSAMHGTKRRGQLFL